MHSSTVSHVGDTSKENFEVLRNLDFWTRAKSTKNILFASDYHGEKHFQTAHELAHHFQEIYRRSVVILDLRQDATEIVGETVGDDIQYQNARELVWLYTGEKINDRKLDAHVKALSEQNSIVFLIQDVRRNVIDTRLPEIEMDAAVLIRSKRSVGAGKKRFVTDLIKDARLPILGLIYNRV